MVVMLPASGASDSTLVHRHSCTVVSLRFDQSFPTCLCLPLISGLSLVTHLSQSALFVSSWRSSAATRVEDLSSSQQAEGELYKWRL